MLFQQYSTSTSLLILDHGHRLHLSRYLWRYRVLLEAGITIILIFLAYFSEPVLADDSVTKLSTGAEYTTGEYGGTRSVDQLYIPVTIRYSKNRYSYRLTVPYTSVAAPSDTILSDGTVIPGIGDTVTEAGIGDVIAGATYQDVFDTEFNNDLAIDFTAKIKFGTADRDKNLGSGENDYTLQTELYKFLDRSMLFSIIGYKFRGDPPGIDLDNSWIIYLGGNYKLTTDYKSGVDIYYQQSAIPGLDDQLEISADLGYRLSATRYLGGYLIKGLSDASPDWGIGFYVTFSL